MNAVRPRARKIGIAEAHAAIAKRYPKVLAALAGRCEHCGEPAQEATYEGRWLCDSCLYLAEFNSPESRADRWYDESKYDV